MSDLRHQIENLSAAEKAELLDLVWESLEADAASLTDVQRAELDYRIEQHEKNPSDVIPWEQVRARLYKKLCPFPSSGCRKQRPNCKRLALGTTTFGVNLASALRVRSRIQSRQLQNTLFSFRLSIENEGAQVSGVFLMGSSSRFKNTES